MLRAELRADQITSERKHTHTIHQCVCVEGSISHCHNIIPAISVKEQRTLIQTLCSPAAFKLNSENVWTEN